MQRRSLRVPVIAAAALAVVGATPTARSDHAAGDGILATPQRISTTVVVRNHNPLDIEVVAVTESGRRYELGSVHSGAGRAFDLPRDVCESSDPFRLKIYSIGRKVGPSVVNRYLEAVKTNPLSPDTGGEIVLQVLSPLSASFIDRSP